MYAECGCGSGETSCQLGTERTLIAVDFSTVALHQALRFPCYAGGLLADIRRLPFRDKSLDGLWNLGVLEHLDASDQLLVLREFVRVLKPNGRLLLWWPPWYGLDHLLLGRMGRWFPPEPARVDRPTARTRLQAAGFQRVTVEFPVSDGFTELVVSEVKD